MGFASLSNLWALIFPLIVIAYYLFRKRFESKTVSSTMFWTHDRREENVSPFLQNLQRNLLFYLQLAALLLFVMLLLGPYSKQDVTEGIPLVFIVDSSATMLAKPTDTTLFDENRKTMKELLQQADGRKVSILVTGKDPQFAVQDSEAAPADRALDQLDVRYEPNYMETSIELVKSLYQEKGAEVHLFTDALDRTEFADEIGKIQWNVHANDRQVNNHSIVRFGAIRNKGTLTAIVKLQHDTEKTAPGTILLKEPEGGKLLGEQSFKGLAGSEELISFKGIESDAPALIAELEESDDYSADNMGVALLDPEHLPVVVDPSLHELLRKAAQAIQEDVEEDTGEEQGDPVVRITSKSSWLHKGVRPVFLIGRDDAEPREVSGDIEVTEDPLFSIASPQDMYVEKIYPPYEGYEILAKVGDAPIIQRSPRGDIVFLADLEATDWPLQPSFPIFVWSAVQALAEDSETLGVFTSLQRKSVVMTEPADVYDMEGTYLSTAESAHTLQAPGKPGIYRATDGTVDKLFVVKLDSSEYRVETGESYTVGSLTGAHQEKEQEKPVIWPFLVPLLLLLLLEWEVQRRRGYPY